MLFLLLSALFSSSETAFVSLNPYTLQYLDSQGSKKARLVKKSLARINDLLATILIGNTLVNAAAASIATSIFVSFYPNENQAVILATLFTTLSILIFGEINPKILAAHRPVKISFMSIYFIRAIYFLFYPLIKFFGLMPRLFLPAEEISGSIFSHHLSEEEVKLVISSGVKGLSLLRKKMLAGVLNLSHRPIREIMVPRTRVKALELNSTLEEVIKNIQESGFSRYPVYRETIDNIEGLFHVKDILPFLHSDKEFHLRSCLRKPLFVPELATIEKVLLQMQEQAIHLALVVDEFGSFEGIVSLEDIIEEIVGDIRDEYDRHVEDWYQKISDDEYIIKGSASIKEINEKLNLGIPEKKYYTTLAG
ncbi:MAG: HlyC/CorC family transporter, partial [Candidatus Aminicenantes bacterium]|nr:HlyC/CorC family transporter [Candidatus Aminicenantes bacterium]